MIAPSSAGESGGGTVPDAAPGDDFTLDGLLGGGVRLLQPRRGYRVAIDPVMLAAAVPAHAGDTVLDLGCGVGAAALCLARRVADVTLVGLEIQLELVELARRNAVLNRIAERFTVHAGDLMAPPAALTAMRFDHVMANPPFRAAAGADPSPIRSKATATVEGAATLAHWLAACFGFLRPGGCVTLIHSPDRLHEIETCLAAEPGAMDVLVLHPKAGAAPKRVIVRFRPRRPPARRMLAALVLHESDGRYTPETERILRAGMALPD